MPMAERPSSRAVSDTSDSRSMRRVDSFQSLTDEPMNSVEWENATTADQPPAPAEPSAPEWNDPNDEEEDIGFAALEGMGAAALDPDFPLSLNVLTLTENPNDEGRPRSQLNRSRPGSRLPSRPASNTGSRQPSRPASQAGLASRQPSRPVSGAASRPASRLSQGRPASRMSQQLMNLATMAAPADVDRVTRVSRPPSRNEQVKAERVVHPQERLLGARPKNEKAVQGGRSRNPSEEGRPASRLRRLNKVVGPDTYVLDKGANDMDDGSIRVMGQEIQGNQRPGGPLVEARPPPSILSKKAARPNTYVFDEGIDDLNDGSIRVTGQEIEGTPQQDGRVVEARPPHSILSRKLSKSGMTSSEYGQPAQKVTGHETVGQVSEKTNSMQHTHEPPSSVSGESLINRKAKLYEVSHKAIVDYLYSMGQGYWSDEYVNEGKPMNPTATLQIINQRLIEAVDDIDSGMRSRGGLVEAQKRNAAVLRQLRTEVKDRKAKEASKPTDIPYRMENPKYSSNMRGKHSAYYRMLNAPLSDSGMGDGEQPSSRMRDFPDNTFPSSTKELSKGLIDPDIQEDIKNDPQAYDAYYKEMNNRIIQDLVRAMADRASDPHKLRRNADEYDALCAQGRVKQVYQTEKEQERLQTSVSQGTRTEVREYSGLPWFDFDNIHNCDPYKLKLARDKLTSRKWTALDAFHKDYKNSKFDWFNTPKESFFYYFGHINRLQQTLLLDEKEVQDLLLSRAGPSMKSAFDQYMKTSKGDFTKAINAMVKYKAKIPVIQNAENLYFKTQVDLGDILTSFDKLSDIGMIAFTDEDNSRIEDKVLERIISAIPDDHRSQVLEEYRDQLDLRRQGLVSDRDFGKTCAKRIQTVLKLNKFVPPVKPKVIKDFPSRKRLTSRGKISQPTDLLEISECPDDDDLDQGKVWEIDSDSPQSEMNEMSQQVLMVKEKQDSEKAAKQKKSIEDMRSKLSELQKSQKQFNGTMKKLQNIEKLAKKVESNVRKHEDIMQELSDKANTLERNEHSTRERLRSQQNTIMQISQVQSEQFAPSRATSHPSGGSFNPGWGNGPRRDGRGYTPDKSRQSDFRSQRRETSSTSDESAAVRTYPFNSEEYKNFWKDKSVDTDAKMIEHLRNSMTDTASRLIRFRPYQFTNLLQTNERPHQVIEGRYVTNTPPFTGNALYVKGNYTQLSVDLLDFFRNKCVKCGIQGCCIDNPKCPMRGKRNSWTLCKKCRRALHLPKDCIVHVPQDERAN